MIWTRAARVAPSRPRAGCCGSLHPMYVGIIIFAALAAVVVLAFLAYLQKKKAYERGEDV